MSARRAPTRRLPALVGVAAAVVGLVALSQAGSSVNTRSAAATQPVAGPSIPPASAISSAWFCAEGTSNTGGRADETVIVANLGRHRLRASVEVLTGSDQPAATRVLELPAFGQQRVAVSSMLGTADPGVVVEAIGGQAVVEHELRRGSTTTVGPCARQAAGNWYFSAGTTTLGSEDWLALFNPFPDDAIVDVTFLTQDGLQAPQQAQAIVVPRRSRLSVPLHTLEPEQGQLGVHVHARIGRIVAEESQFSDGSNGPAGLATALGSTAAAPSWQFPTGVADAGVAASLQLANFTGSPTKATVSITLDNNAALPNTAVLVPSLGVASVNPITGVPPGTGFAISVRAPRRAPVVAELVQAWAAPAPTPGIAMTFGATTAAKRWAFATGRLDSSGDAQVAARDVSGRPVSVELLAFTAGDPNSPRSAPAQALSSGKRAVFALTAAGVDPDQVTVVQADHPIVAGRVVLAPGPAMSIGIPALP